MGEVETFSGPTALPPAGRRAAAPLALGPMIVGRAGLGASDTVSRGRAPEPGDFAALYLLADGSGGARVEARLLDAHAPPPVGRGSSCVVVLAPHRVFAGVAASATPPDRSWNSVGFGVLRSYLEGLLNLGPTRLSERQKELAGDAIAALLASALADGEGRSLAYRRRASLSERLVAHVDAHLQDALTADSICRALACSRSALYRAAAGAGGVSELITTRRLIAIGAKLRGRHEARPIAKIAEAYGFCDVSNFNRRFKAHYGASPGAFRSPGASTPPAVALRPSPSVRRVRPKPRRRSAPCS